jgi:N6-L-threonylcarbamoyladenine synthase
MLHSDDCDFSFSGIKTAVLYQVQALDSMSDEQRRLIAAEFENAVTEVVLKKTARALEETNAQTFVIGGGVSANAYLRKELTKYFSTEHPDLTLRLPDASLSTDNALMIGMAGYFMHLREAPTVDSSYDLRASGTMKMYEQ